MMDKMPFLDVSLILAIKNMFCAITILSGILLLFPIFISMKIDGKLSWSWPAVFIPSFIVLGLVFAGAIFAPMSNDDEEPEDQRASMIVRILQKLYNSAYIGALVAFDVLIALRLESIITCNWGTVFVPWFMIEASNLLSGIASTVSRLREGVHLVVPETLDDEVEHNTASRAFTFSEVLYLVFQDYHFIFLRICQEVMLVEKLDSDTLSWG
ncbi:hypothetical protein BC830DRAFT_200740 [Chytriomyces sp. MP71]|nr:hypothetical protein BC830DRAFT_200740 [Chytriomyces sp. MP71]